MSDHKTKWTAIKDEDKNVLGYKITDRGTGDMLSLVTKTGSTFNIERLYGNATAYNGASAFNRMTDLQEALDGFATDKPDESTTRKDAVSAALKAIKLDESQGVAYGPSDEVTEFLNEQDADTTDVETPKAE